MLFERGLKRTSTYRTVGDQPERPRPGGFLVLRRPLYAELPAVDLERIGLCVPVARPRADRPPTHQIRFRGGFRPVPTRDGDQSGNRQNGPHRLSA